MRFALIALAFTCSLACPLRAEDEAPKPDGDAPASGISAEESARILAEIKAKRDAAKAAKGDAGDEKPATTEKPKPEADAKATDEDAKKKAAKLADEYEDKATKAAQVAVKQAEQFRVRAKAEGGSASGRSVYMHKVNLDSGATNGAVLDAVDRVKELLKKRDEARSDAGLPALKTISVTDYILKNGG